MYVCKYKFLLKYYRVTTNYVRFRAEMLKTRGGITQNSTCLLKIAFVWFVIKTHWIVITLDCL